MLILKARTILLKLKEISNTLLVAGCFFEAACKKDELTGITRFPE
jgi:hypothetical protein